MSYIICIYGPTASGKSGLAVELAKYLSTSIINADSAQVYYDCPILNNLPTIADYQQVPHLLFNFLSCIEDFSVAKWLKLCEIQINQLTQQAKIPIVVGGSGLYLNALLEGIVNIPTSQLHKQEASSLYNVVGHDAFLNTLNKVDKDNKYYDKQRMIRSYAIYLATGTTMSAWQNQAKSTFLTHKMILIYLKPPRDELYQTINHRTTKMLQQGAILEVEKVLNGYQNYDFSDFKKFIGFQEIKHYLNHKINYQQLLVALQQNTRRYAKRQYTWFNNKINYHTSPLIEKLMIKTDNNFDYQLKIVVDNLNI